MEQTPNMRSRTLEIVEIGSVRAWESHMASFYKGSR